MEKNINELADVIETKADFEAFLTAFLNDYRINKEEWENNSLEPFLEALAVYAKDVDGYYKNFDIPFDETKPTWRNFADILLGAKVYE